MLEWFREEPWVFAWTGGIIVIAIAGAIALGLILKRR